ncbi:hypothetical protein MKX03_008294 [Papaver bracteatum]|nr:hypothetical protein MKX03_008294 [Papaver bracteatum]
MAEVVKQRKKGKSQGKTPSKEPEIACLGHLHDLFIGKEEEILVLNDIQWDLLATTTFWNLLQVFTNNQITKDELKIPQAGLNKLTDSYTNSEDWKGEFLLRKKEGY